MGKQGDERVIENRTPWRLVIETGGESPCLLGPQIERPLKDGWERADLAPWFKAGFIRWADEDSTEASASGDGEGLGGRVGSISAKAIPFLTGSAKILGYAFFFFFVLGAVAATLENISSRGENPLAIVSSFAVAAGLTFFAWLFFEGQGQKDGWARLKRTRALQNLSLVGVLVIAISGPLFALQVVLGEGLSSWFFGIALANHPPPAPDPARLGNIVLVVFLTVASLLPALLYYLFDRQQIGTLRRRFFSDAIRLDPSVWTLDEAERKFGRRVDEFIGLSMGARRRLVAGSRSPIVFCTAIITLGWILTLVSGDAVGDVEAVVAADNAEMPAILQRFVLPEAYFIYGFLGAYVFAVLMLIRRYVTGDLQPKTYSDIAVRVIVAMIFGWMIEPGLAVVNAVTAVLGGANETAAAVSGRVYGSGGQLLAFTFGVFPQTGLAWLTEAARSLKSMQMPFARRGRRLTFFPGTVERHPLNYLEGIDLYDRARLMEEGVASISHLAHGDMIDLMLRTRIPSRRLVDMVDQAILYIHLAEGPEDSEEGRDHLSKALLTLRSFGIRTATDLERAYKAACERDDDPRCGSREGEVELLSILGSHPGSPPKLRVALDALRDDEWMREIRYWRLTSQETGTITRADLDRIAAGESPTPDLRPATVHGKL